jgi:2-polyprenyl-3-methyl-5-hydroxy-6-metoxy-1,4-benzoquinol methylase
LGPTTEYYKQVRTDVAALVPGEARKVLDVGCGFGSLGRFLSETQGCDMHGVELNPEAGPHLQGVYSRFVLGDAGSAFEKFAGEQYDCIIFADILEHLADPWCALNNYVRLLAPTGVVVASIPNVRNLALIYNLAIRGTWTYTDSGLLDRTHLRFFTRREIWSLFHGAGLEIERIAANHERFSPVQRVAAALPTLLVPDLAVCQFLVRGRRLARSS